MITTLRVAARTVVFRFPLLLKAARFVLRKGQKVREARSLSSLLLELNGDVVLQIPELVEQNRKMYRELQSLKEEVEFLKRKLTQK